MPRTQISPIPKDTLLLNLAEARREADEQDTKVDEDD